MSFNIEVQGGTSVRLPTAGKYCDRDIVITVTGSGGTAEELDDVLTEQEELIERLKEILDEKASGSGEAIPEQEKVIDITKNGTYEVTHDEGYTLAKVTANVNVPSETPNIQPLEVTENGTYTAPDGVDGYSPVTVNVSEGGRRVRYIESSGLEAIDTGIIIEETDVIECDFELLDLSASGDKMLFGVIESGGSIWAETYGTSNNWYVRFGHTSSVSITWNNYQTAGTIRLEKGKAILNGASAVTLGYTSLPTVSCALFARKTTSGDYDSKRAMRSLGFRIIAASGLPKINLVPWVTDAGDVGMRDLVTGAFFGNAAAEGAFVASSY